MSREILDCLKRKQDICIKNIIPSQNTAFMFTPALRGKMRTGICLVFRYQNEIWVAEIGNYIQNMGMGLGSALAKR